jgi:hypothetical protein
MISFEGLAFSPVRIAGSEAARSCCLAVIVAVVVVVVMVGAGSFFFFGELFGETLNVSNLFSIFLTQANLPNLLSRFRGCGLDASGDCPGSSPRGVGGGEPILYMSDGPG